MNSTPNPNRNRDITLRDLLEIFRANIALFIASVVVALAVAALYLATIPPTYTRTASILIKDEKEGKGIGTNNIESFKELGLLQSNTNISNEITLIQSPAFMQEVVRRLGLNNNYKVKDGLLRWRELYNNAPFKVEIDSLLEDSKISFKVIYNSQDDYEIEDLTIGNKEYEKAELKEGIKIEKSPFFNDNTIGRPYIFTHRRVKNVADEYLARLDVALQKRDASVVDLTITDEVPQRAENAINTLISVYNENWIKDINAVTHNTNSFIEDRLKVIEQELGVVDSDISSFKSNHLMPDVAAAANIQLTQSTENRSQKLLLENQLSMAQYIRSYLMDVSKSSELIPVCTGIESKTIESEIIRYNELLLQRDALLANSGLRNPLIKEMDEQLSALKAGIINSVSELITTLSMQMSNAQRVEKETKTQLAENPNHAKELINIERQQGVKEALYLYLLQKREENELSQAFTAYNTKIISLADGSETPTSPRKYTILLYALLIGVVVPVVYLYIKESLDTYVKSKRDIEWLNIPLLGSIPTIDIGAKKVAFGMAHRNTTPLLIDTQSSRSISNEAFRVVRTNLDFILGKQSNCKVIQIISLNPSSGKSFISANLSNSMSMKKEVKVLVIDCDMRKSALSRYIDTPKLGLSNYLNGSIDNLDEIITRGKISPTLDVIAVGTVPPNPSELLLTDRFDEIVSELKKRYNYIFFDCPPVEIVPDSAIVGKHCDTAIFVIRAGNFDKRLLPEVTTAKESGKYNNMCLLLNDVDYKSNGYCYGYAKKE